MTDTMPEQSTEDEQDWSEGQTATYPEFPDNPHNHRYTISFDGRGPMVVVRGNTAAEVMAAYQELEQSAVGAAMGNAWSAIKAAAAVAAGLGATPVPQGAPAAPQPPAMPGVPTPPPFGPNVSVPQAPGFQNGGGFPAPPAPPAVQDNAPEFKANGWYRLVVPYPKKGAFDAVVTQYGMKKGRPSEGGVVSFNKADKSWYVAQSHAGAFGDFSPMPA